MLLVIDTDEEDLREVLESRVEMALEEINDDPEPITVEQIATKLVDIIVNGLVEMDEGTGLHSERLLAEE